MSNEDKVSPNQDFRFTVEVKIAGINPYVGVPLSVVNALGGGTKAAVLVKVAGINKSNESASNTHKENVLTQDAERLKAIGRLAPGGWFRSTLVPSRSGPTRLYLDQWMRETAGVSVGDRVQVILKSDHGSRELTIPDTLQETLNSNPDAQAAWEALAPSRKREILTYLNFLKSPAALERNVRKVIANLLANGDPNP